MPPRGRPRAPPKLEAKRSSSLELGDGDFAIKYDKRTGRPIRNSAGKKQMDPDFITPADYIDADPEDVSSEDLDEEEVEALDELAKRKRTLKAKNARKRSRDSDSPSPPLSPLPLSDADLLSDEDTPEAPSEEENDTYHSFEPITFVFNIPLGFQGPLEVKLDPSQFRPAKRMKYDTSNVSTPSKGAATAPVEQRKKGFLQLPPELRNKVYNSLFKSEEPLSFSHPAGFARSTAFLRTCKTIHEEGRTILYGQNTFVFARRRQERSPAWESGSNNNYIGYKDIVRFLKSIGPVNVALLRKVAMEFEDTCTSYGPLEERRYVNDVYLQKILKFLGSQAKLQKLKLAFGGRRSLTGLDQRFIELLVMVDADEVTLGFEPHRWGEYRKIKAETKDRLIKNMERKKKMYEGGVKKVAKIRNRG